ncbi:nitrite/sulfite reductase [Hydrogenimonas sp. SS33]|uniref:nitrite/sulfite reductase n=1 Tax=Hydrogenimonas leucolamina TaxID=2954236 RepID=UPI00336BB007
MEPVKLNKIEKLKRKLPPASFLPKLEAIDEKEVDEEARFYLKNFGIYSHKLDPGRYNLRVRIPAGRITPSALGVLAEEASALDARVLLTSRAQIEIHDLTLKEAVALAERVEGWGLTTWQTYTDNFRNIVTDPLDDIAEDAEIEVYDIVMAMQSLFLKAPEWVGMIPRKFNVAITGRRKQTLSFFGNDLFFALARREDKWGFNLYAGGKNSETARSLDIFLPPEEAPAYFRAVAEIYREEGPRQSRGKARLFHLLERTGAEGMRRRIAERLGVAVQKAGRLMIEKDEAAETAPMKGGGVVRRYGTRLGEVTSRQLEEIAQIAEEEGLEEIRLGCDQQIYLPGVSESRRFAHALRSRSGLLACAGSRYCVYSLTDTKEAGAAVDSGRLERLGIRIGFSGCLKGCARHAFSDIGLVGIRTKLYADEVERGARLYLGSEYTRGARTGRLILYSVPMRHLSAMIDLVADLFEASGYDDFEIFAKEVLNRYSEPALAFWLLYNFHRSRILHYKKLLLLENIEHEDEKGYFVQKLEEEGRKEDREIIALLQSEEAFPFREAIIYLERASFRKMKSPEN